MDVDETQSREKSVMAGASKGTPGDAKCVTEILGRTKIRKLGEDKV